LERSHVASEKMHPTWGEVGVAGRPENHNRKILF